MGCKGEQEGGEGSRKEVRLRRADEESWEELNGVKECSLGERAERHRHSSSMAALGYSHFFFAKYYGLADVQLLATL